MNIGAISHHGATERTGERTCGRPRPGSSHEFVLRANNEHCGSGIGTNPREGARAPTGQQWSVSIWQADLPLVILPSLESWATLRRVSDPTLTRETIYDGPEITRPTSVVIDPASDDLVQVERDIDGFVAHVFARIAAAFLISAFFASYSDRLTDNVALTVSSQALFLLIGGMLALAVVVSRKVADLPISVATATLVGYAALQGILFGLAFRTAYGCSFAPGYVSIAVVFGLLCVFGTRSGRDLTGFAPLFAGSITAFVVALCSIFLWDQKAVAALAACVQCWLTLALVGYHRDFIRDLPSSFENDPKWQKAAVIGALQIYLDVVIILIIIMQARWLSELTEDQQRQRKRSLF